MFADRRHNANDANQNSNMNTMTTTTTNTKAALRLPSTYKVHTSISGFVRTGAAVHERARVELRIMASSTHGHVAVHALDIIHDGRGWREISGGRWQALALAVITDATIDWLKEVAK